MAELNGKFDPKKRLARLSARIERLEMLLQRDGKNKERKKEIQDELEVRRAQQMLVERGHVA